ncbi:hypothetical protein CsSME_00011074 [Camellia sinensis var. sinensis]
MKLLLKNARSSTGKLNLLLLIIDVQMNLMMGDIPHLLDVIWSWISPSEGKRLQASW